MIIDNTNYWHSPVRSLVARVELYKGSALADAYTAYYALKSFSIERAGEEGKFFGFGICQKMNLKLVDKDRYISITTEHSLKPYLSTGGNLITSCPAFYVTEANRDENTNELSVTAYDALYNAVEHTVSELGLVAPYTIKTVADACAVLLGVGAVEIIGVTEAVSPFDTEYPEGANFGGEENIRSVLNAIAEATQTIYYINNENNLVFKRLDINGDPVVTIGKADYFMLESGTNRRLSTVFHATELGDNVSASTVATGSTQYVRDNPFWDLREDIATLVDNALAAIGGLTINQFTCAWRGNFFLEIGDKIGLITKDDKTVTSYVLDDVINYNGSLAEETQWNYTEDEAETASNPTSLGDALNQTFARVDKVNQEITMQVTKVEANTSAIAALQINSDSINASVSKVAEILDDTKDSLEDDISAVKTELAAFKLESNQAIFEFQETLDNGIEEVTTTSGYTFNKDGLNISQSGNPVNTTITQDGMVIKRNSENVLVANNAGVKAEDLHATTFLIIGKNSRFEDYDSNTRTGCFWIGS